MIWVFPLTFLLGFLLGSRSSSPRVSPYLRELLGYFLLLASGAALAFAALVLVVL